MKIGKTLGIGTGTVQSVLIEQPGPFEAGARSRPLPQSKLADVLETLSPAQLVKIAASSQVLCRFRFDDHAILSSLADKEKSAALAQTHSAILMAGQSAGQIG